MLFFITQFTIAFILVGLRAAQTSNVIHFRYLSATVCSIVTGIVSVSSIGLVSSDPWASVIPVTIGGTLGLLFSMHHNDKK